HDPVLNVVQFDVQHLSQVLLVQGVEHDDLIDSVHKLGRKLALRDVKSRVIHLAIDIFKVRLVLPDAGREPNSSGQHLTHFDGTEVRRHKHNTSGEVHFAIVPER